MEEVKKLLRQNLEYSKEMHEMLTKVRRYIIFQQVFNVIKIVIILVPVILAIIYALPFFREALGTYNEVLGAVNSLQEYSGGNGGVSGDLLQKLLK